MSHTYLKRSAPIIALVILLLIGPLLPAAAQGSAPFCGGLSASDCQLLQDALVAMTSIHSVSVPAWSASLDIRTREEIAALNASGSAAVVIPPNVYDWANQFFPDTLTDPTALLPIMNQVNAEFLRQALEGLFLHFVVNGFSVSGPASFTSGSFEVIYKNNMAYRHYQAPNGAFVWAGMPVRLDAQDMADLDAALAQARQDLQDVDVTALLETLYSFSDAQQRLQTIAGRYVITTRGADEMLDGQAMAVFTTAIDLPGFLSDPELPAVLLEIVHSPALAGRDPHGDLQNINEAQIRFGLLAMRMALAQDTTISVEQWIGRLDSYLHIVNANLRLGVNVAAFNAGAIPQDTVYWNFIFSATLADYDAVSPDSVITPDQFLSPGATAG